MIRFVAIASIRRGAIRPAEVLDYAGQAAAIYQLERDTCGEIREPGTVVWKQGRPIVDYSAGAVMGARVPRVGARVLADLKR
jgi:hypothetical protein